MNCRDARGLFGAYWDDEITQAEREWLEGHFASCDRCRLEYEEFSRPIEALGQLPRHEVAPGFVDRVLVRARPVRPAPDRLPIGAPVWVPVTATAALVLIALMMALPWLGIGPGGKSRPGTEPRVATREPALVQTAGGLAPSATDLSERTAGPVAGSAADSLFDHSADVEFVLDPVMLRRGQASLSRQAPPATGERAVVSF